MSICRMLSRAARFAAAIAALVMICMVRPAAAQTREITGQAGILAEWDLTATVTEGAKGHFSGPLSLKHVGFCSADGPEERTGEMSLIVAEPPDTVTATLAIDGNTCTFTGRLKGGYDGMMRCPGRSDMPMMLFLP